MFSVLIILILSFLDITLTHYQLFLARKKGVMDMRAERSFIPRLIIRGNPNPKNFIIGCVFSLSLFGLVSSFADNETIGFFAGALVMVNLYHLIQIKDVYCNWNNKNYWKIKKIIKKLIK